MRIIVAILSLILATVTTTVVSAESNGEVSPLDKRAVAVYQDILSPFCPGRSLNDCPSSKAQELKTDIRQKLEQGIAEDQILNEVFSTFGDQYRAIPKNTGFGRLVWLAPAAFLVVGAFGILAMAQRKKVTGAPPAHSPEPISPQMQEEIRRALNEVE
jgi:cytochrome c-type biogenesis protein CcmH